MPSSRLTRAQPASPSALVLMAILTLIMLAGCNVQALARSHNDTVQASAVPSNAGKLDVDTVRDHVIVRYTIANLGRDSSVRNLRSEVVEHGWQPFVKVALAQLRAQGLHRIMLHTPFGRERPVQFDAYLEAKRMHALNKVTGTFVQAWRDNVTKPSLNNNIEVIGYIGSPRLDPDSKEILKKQGQSAFWKRADEAVAPLVEANMSIALDAAAPADKDSITYQLAQRLRGKVPKVYIEANPAASHTWWFDYPVIVLDSTWQKRRNKASFASRKQLKSELVRIVRLGNHWMEHHPKSKWPDAICRIIAEGDTVAMPGRLLLQPQRNISGLVDCANKLR